MRSGHVHLIGTNQRAICVFSLSQSKIFLMTPVFFFFSSGEEGGLIGTMTPCVVFFILTLCVEAPMPFITKIKAVKG